MYRVWNKYFLKEEDFYDEEGLLMRYTLSVNFRCEDSTQIFPYAYHIHSSDYSFFDSSVHVTYHMALFQLCVTGNPFRDIDTYCVRFHLASVPNSISISIQSGIHCCFCSTRTDGLISDNSSDQVSKYFEPSNGSPLKSERSP